MDEFREIQASLRDRHDHGPDADEDQRSRGSCRGLNDDKNAFLYPCIPVLQQGVDVRQPLPVPLDGELPHFFLNIGHSISAPNPSLMSCVDTGDGANVGYIEHFDGILFQHPEYVERIFCVNDDKYSAICMTGIVSEDTNGVTSTDLPITVQLKNPYCNRDGRRVDVTVALGSTVSINFILSNA